MAKVTVLYWQDIPSVVEARDPGGRHKIELSQRFQELIDLIAMKKKVMGTDEYLNYWSKGPSEDHDGDAATAAPTRCGWDRSALRGDQGRGNREMLRMNRRRGSRRRAGSAVVGEKSGPRTRLGPSPRRDLTAGDVCIRA